MKRAALVLLLFAALPAMAKNANELKAECSNNSPGGTLFCAGYLTAVFDSNISTVFTVTGNYQVWQFKDAFLDYMREHPEKGDIPASWLLPIAWESRKLVAFLPPPTKTP